MDNRLSEMKIQTLTNRNGKTWELFLVKMGNGTATHYARDTGDHGLIKSECGKGYSGHGMSWKNLTIVDAEKPTCKSCIRSMARLEKLGFVVS